MHMMHGYGSLWSMIIMIMFWIGLISLGIFLITNFIDRNNGNNSLNIIQERLAKGEIDETEYERLKSIIKQDRK